MKITTTKQREAAKMNLSLAVFFCLSAASLSYVLSLSSIGLQGRSWALITLYAILCYFMWDFIKQLYNSGEAVALYCLTFVVLPGILGLANTELWLILRTGVVVYVICTMVSLIMEVVYVSMRILMGASERSSIGDSLDHSLVHFHDKHLALFDLRGFLFGVLLIVGYIFLAYMLLVA